jgi:hypothetical protein
VNGEHKISSGHRDRKALIYLRQSSMAQVRHHTESTRSQYALADRAAEMGWARRDIEVTAPPASATAAATWTVLSTWESLARTRSWIPRW